MEEKKMIKYRSLNDPISLEDLKTFLWDAATRLRGQIDAAGYKEYIFPLLFFKRISDVYDQLYSGFAAEGGVEYANMQAQDLPIRIPDGAHWDNVRNVTVDVGKALVDAFRLIEQANPGEEADGRIVGGLENIFGPKDGWTNKAKMPDHIITSLIEDFSRYRLNLLTCPADEMGQAYEYLIGKFADDAGNTAQEFYTNRTVVTLMAEILEPKPDETIYDPTCGSGGMLIKCLNYLKNKNLPWQGVKVFGQEINAISASIARMNLYLNGVEDFSIVRKDTLLHPAFVDGSRLRKFDIVLANPPYSIKTWNREAFMNDKWGRNMWGTPIQARADYAFIQHIIASMNETGRCAILLPHGVLNREEDKEIRINHIKSDTIDAIIGLGRHLFYNSGLESFIFICRNNKPSNRKNKILFIEAEKYTHKEGKQAYLYPEDIEKILKAYYSDNDIQGFSKHVSIDEIIANGGNLNIKSYVKAVNTSEEKSLYENLVEYVKIQNELTSSLCKLPFVNDEPHIFDAAIKDNTIDKSNWKIVKLSEVAEEYAVRVDNPSKSQFNFFIGSDCIGQYDFRIHKRSDASTITSTQKGFSNGDYLLVRRSLYGSDFRERAPRADFDGVCSADILTIREKKDVIADGFLIYVLYQKELWDFIVSNSNGGLTRRIKWKQLADYQFSLPPLSEQRVLSEKLWAAYRLKEAYKKLLVATDEMVKAKFVEMIKKAKSFDTLESVCLYLGKGITPKYVEQSSAVVINQACIYWDGLRLDNIKYHNTDVSVKKRLLQTGDVLLNATGNGTLGRSCIFKRPSDDNIYINDSHVISIETNRELILPEVLNSYFALPDTQGEIYRKYVTGSTNQSDIVFTELKQMPIPLPDMSEQVDFVKILNQAEKSKTSLLKSIESIDSVIKSLINNQE